MKKFFNLLDSFCDLRHSINSVRSSFPVSVRLFYFFVSVSNDILFMIFFLAYVLGLGIVEFPA